MTQPMHARELLPKHSHLLLVLVQLTNTFWKSINVHRTKLQVPFAITVFCRTGGRVDAFFPEKENRDKWVRKTPHICA